MYFVASKQNPECYQDLYQQCHPADLAVRSREQGFPWASHSLTFVLFGPVPTGCSGDLSLEEKLPHHHSWDGQVTEDFIHRWCHLCFLGHLVRMPDNCLAKQLFMLSPVGGKHAVRGQKRRWNDVVSKVLRLCNLSKTWREKLRCMSPGVPPSNTVLHFSTKKQSSMRKVTKMKCSDVVSSGSLIQRKPCIVITLAAPS